MKVAHETHGVERRRLQDDLDIVVVSVQPRAGMVGGKAADKMRGGKAEALADPVHGGASPDQARWRSAGPTTGPAVDVIKMWDPFSDGPKNDGHALARPRRRYSTGCRSERQRAPDAVPPVKGTTDLKQYCERQFAVSRGGHARSEGAFYEPGWQYAQVARNG